MRNLELTTMDVKAYADMPLGELADRYTAQMTIIQRINGSDQFTRISSDVEAGREATEHVILINSIARFKFGLVFGTPT